MAAPAAAATVSTPAAQVIPEGVAGSEVPLSVTGPVSGVLGVDLVLRYNGGGDGDVLSVPSAAEVLLAGDLAGWTVATNLVPNVDGFGTDEIRVSAAAPTSSLALAVADGVTEPILRVRFTAIATVSPKASPFTVVSAALNEGAIAVTTASGTVVLGGTTGTLSLSPNPVRPTQPVRITVTDADLNQAAGTAETVTVSVSTGGETQSVQLTETGLNTGVFAGQIATAYGAAAQGTVPLEIVSGNQIQATYGDALNGVGTALAVTSTIAVSPNVNGTASSSPAVLTIGAPVTVQVIDADLNADPTVAESVTVTVINASTGETETLVLVETGPDTGIFQAQSPTAAGAGTSGNGTLSVNGGDRLAVSYTDAIGANGQPGGMVLSVTPATASFASLPADLNVGETLSIQVNDLFTSFTGGTRVAGLHQIAVTVTNTTTGEQELVSLSESVAGSGQYSGSVPSRFDADPLVAAVAGTLELRPGNAVSVRYADPMATGGTPLNVDSAAIPVLGTDGTVATAPAAVAAGGSALTLTVQDIDLSGAGSVAVQVQVRRGGQLQESENATLTEGALGTFTGTLNTANSAIPAPNGLLDVQAGDQLVALYTDATGQDLASHLRRSVTPATAAFGALPAAIDVGDGLTITVADADLAAGTRVTGNGILSVTVSTTGGAGDTETLTLTETVGGTFVGILPTVYDAVPGAAGTVAGALELRPDPAYGITVAYTDGFGVNGAPATIVATVAVDAGTTGAVVIVNAGIIAVGGSASLRLTDADLNNDAGLAESATVAVRNVTTGGVESVVLTETGQSTEIFVGTLATAGVDPGAGVLGAVAGDQLVARYDDVIGSDGQPHPGLLSVTPTTAAFTSAPTQVKVSLPLVLELTDLDMSTAAGATRISGPGTLLAVVSTAGGGGDSESILLTETGTGTGVFTGSLVTIYDADAGSVGTVVGALELRPGAAYQIAVSYADPLAAGGGTADATASVEPIGGASGVLAASDGVQVGDSLRIQLADSDLDLTATADTVRVRVGAANLAYPDSETVALIETGAASGVFRGKVGTVAGPASRGDGILQMEVNATLDRISVRYADAVTASGGPAQVTALTTPVVWGDASRNSILGAYDASLILRHSVNDTSLAAYSALVADVEPAGVNGINSWDATLVLRKVVLLPPDPTNLAEPRFPVQYSTTSNHPFKPVSDTRLVAFGPVVRQGALVNLPVTLDETAGVLSGDLTLRFDPAQYRVVAVRPTPRTAGFLMASRVTGGELRIAWAAAQAEGDGPGAILEVQLQALAGESTRGALEFSEVVLNNGQLQVSLPGQALVLGRPTGYELAQNWPNPFNPETSVRYSLAEPGLVHLTIYGLLGQQVRVLVNGLQGVGTYAAVWDGRDEQGRAVATGTYIYRLEAGSYTQTRKMTLVR
jgi:hypothetical protein